MINIFRKCLPLLFLLNSLLLQNLGASSTASTIALGALQNPGNFDLSTHASDIDYSLDLDSETYYVRLPCDFDPNETYGVISFIASGSGGSPAAAWTPILDKYRMIWIGGIGIGNSGTTQARRRGKALLGAFRATELYNIDPNRIYMSGNSGGARAASNLAFMRDDVITGVISNVGQSFPDSNLPEDFVTSTSRSGTIDYAYLSFGFSLSNLLDQSTTARVAMLTYYNTGSTTSEGDFREQEHINIYHNGYYNHGANARLVEHPGGHGTKTEASLDEAFRFVEHPMVTIINDDFEDADVSSNSSGTGSGWDLSSGSATELSIPGEVTANEEVAQLPADSEIRSKEAFDWNDCFGMILDASLRSDANADYNQKMGIALIPASAQETAALKIEIDQTSVSNKTARMVLTDRSGTATELFSFTFDSADEPLNRSQLDRAYYNETGTGPSWNFRGMVIHCAIDDTSFQITFRQNIDRSTFSSSVGAVILNDNWTILGQWEDLGLEDSIDGLKPIRDWRIALSNTAINSANAANSAYIDHLKVVNSSTASTPAADGSESNALLFQQETSSDRLVAVDAEHYHRQDLSGIHNWSKTSSISGYAGTGAVIAGNDTTTIWSTEFEDRTPRLDYLVEFNQAGIHYVWVRGYAPDATSASCHIGLQGYDINEVSTIDGFTVGNYSWQTISSSDGTPAVINIPTPGIYNLSLWMRESGFIADKLLLTTNENYTPSGSGPTESATRAFNISTDSIQENQAPMWNGEPIVLTAATVRESYSVSAASQVNDIEGNTITFNKISGPSWLSVDSNGLLQGSPELEDVGLNTFIVSASDGIEDPVEATLEIEVINSHSFDLQPVADSYVRGGGTANTNFGTATVLPLKGGSSSPSFTRYSYYRFDLSTLVGQTIKQAYLRLRPVNGSTSSSTAHELFLVNDDSWGETTITWNNRPAEGNLIESATPPLANEWLVIDITTQLATELAGDQSLSLMLSCSDETYWEYYSKEADADSRPQIVFAINTGTPEWTADPFVQTSLNVAAPYFDTLTSYVNDADNDPIIFSKVSGPDWLNMTSDSQLSGVPTFGDVGLNTFIFSASDGVGQPVESTMEILIEIPDDFHLIPEADSYVRGGSYANDNYGSDSTLILKNSGGLRFRRVSYLRFDVSPLQGGNISKAYLRLKVSNQPSISGVVQSLSYVDNDAWEESTITWNNQPTATTVIDTYEPQTLEDWVVFDITSQLATELAGDALLSLKLETNLDQFWEYHTKEASEEDRPQIYFLNPFEIWEIENSVATIDSGESKDPDKDGLNNLLEYAFGGSPLQADPAPDLNPESTIIESNGSNFFEFSYRRRTDATAVKLSYIVETSEDLDDWAPGNEVSTSTTPIDASFEKVTTQVDLSGSNASFIRLRIEQAP